MSPLIKILTVSISAGFISSIVAVVSAFIIVRIFFDKLNIIFPGGSSDYSTSEKVTFLICLGILIFSFIACPYLAYYIRRSIFDFTNDAFLRVILFTVVGSSQFIFLTLEYFIFPYAVKEFQRLSEPPSPETLQRKRKDKITKQVNNANIDVNVRTAKIIYDDGKNIVGEFTLQIKNVPTTILDYSIEIQRVNNSKNFVVGTRNSFKNRLKFNSLKAVNENNKWIFYGQPGNEFISDNSNAVILQINFFRSTPDSKELPQTITPYLRTMLSDKNVIYAQIEIFNRPIPVSFENS